MKQKYFPKKLPAAQVAKKNEEGQIITNIHESKQLYLNHFINQITLTKEFCTQPLRLVLLIVCTKTELERDIEYRCIKNLSGFKGFTSDYRS